MKRTRLLALCAATSLVAAACGGGSNEPDAAPAPETTAAPTTEAPPTTAAPTTTGAPVTEPPVTEPPAPVRPVLDPQVMNAGPISVTPVVCEMDIDFTSGRASEGLAVAGERIVVGSSLGVYAFQASDGPDCVLTTDTDMVAGGLLIDDDSHQSVSGTANGRLLATGLFDSVVFDTNEGFSYDCDLGGRAEISPGGDLAYGHWPGRETIEVWSLDASVCSQGEDVDVGTQFVGTIDAQDNGLVYVGAADGDGLDYVAAFDTGFQQQWQAGSNESGALDSWASVLDVTACGPYTCLLEWFGTLVILDEAGEVIGVLDIDEALGTRSADQLVAFDDDTLYVLASNSDTDVNDESVYFDYVIRLDFTFG